MRYYRILKDTDFYKIKNGIKIAFQYIGGELITEKEFLKFYGFTPEKLEKLNFIETVNISRKKTHFFFGARFEDDNSYINFHPQYKF